MSRQNFNFRRAFYRDSNASLHAPPFITAAGESGIVAREDGNSHPVAEQMDREVYSVLETRNAKSREGASHPRERKFCGRNDASHADNLSQISEKRREERGGKGGEGEGGTTWPYHQLRDEYRSIMPGYFIASLPPGSLPDHRSKVRALSRN